MGDSLKTRHRTAAAAATFLCADCASAIDGTTQTIAMATAPEIAAACTFTNERGEWKLITPGTVNVLRSQSVLRVRCTKSGYQDETAYLAPQMSSTAMVGMMMPYVGILAAAVDGSNGAAMKYPDNYTLTLKPATATTAQASTAASEAQKSGRE